MIISDLNILEVVQANDVVGGTGALAAASLNEIGPSLGNVITYANAIKINTPFATVSNSLAASDAFVGTLGAAGSSALSAANA